MTAAPAPMSLGQLLGASAPAATAGIEVRGLCSDSRSVEPGDAFIALSGQQHDGRDFIAQAIDRGAIVILLESVSGARASAAKGAVPVVEIADLASRIGAIAADFYAHPSAHMHVIGVTGTNGKTTCTWLLAGVLAKLAGQAGLIGTLGWGNFGARGEDLQSTGMTTPDALQVQRCLAALKRCGCDYVAMEVSSHAMSQARVAQVEFDTAIFTNLSRDHLDFHGDMQAYSDAKRALFDVPGLRNAVLNGDDEVGRAWATSLPAGLSMMSYSTSNNNSSTTNNSGADVYADNIRYAMHGLEADVITPHGSGRLRTHLIGEFNLSNSLAVLAALLLAGFALPELLAALGSVPAVPGRMQRVGVDIEATAEPDITVVVDYAHTPEALGLALQALRPHARGGLSVVFGAGGDRDRGKRPLMGEVAERHADAVILTNDNPRGERPDSIVADIRAGMRVPQAAHIELDRGKAIAYAIKFAAGGDVVLIAGKGHEDYQHVGDQRLHFSDCEVARRELLRRYAA